MNTEVPPQPNMALLIDADNISARYLPTILDELPKHGVATYRRIYGDFTDPQAASWRKVLLDNSILPVQQFSNVKDRGPGEQAGKNATDSALIIDAMDILYGGMVDGFIIVSSDSDFTRLAQRLRESNMKVVGMGMSHTSVSFRHACTAFIDIESLYRISENEKSDQVEPNEMENSPSAAEEGASTDAKRSGRITLAMVEDVVAGIVRNNDGKGEVTWLSAVGAGLRNKYPDFDVRTFGYTQLSKMIGDMDRFELLRSGNVYSVSIAGASYIADMERFVRNRLAQNKSGSMRLSTLAQEVYGRFPGFKLKDAGYSQFSQFADSIDGVRVSGAKRQMARLA